MNTTTITGESQAQAGLVTINEGELRAHLDQIVTGAVEETLNQLLDAEAEALCQARRYERTATRQDTRAGHYARKLQTRAGEVTLKVPKLRQLTFETAIIERYQRREASVEEALIEMYLAGVSVRRVEDITEALWGTKVSASTVSDLNQKLYLRLDDWLARPLTGDFAYVYLDGLWLKKSWGGEVQTVSVLVAVGVSADGYREILGVAEGMKEDTASWRDFLRGMRARGLQGIRLVVSDCCLGLVEALGEVFPEAAWQRCVVHFYRNVLGQVPRGKSREVATMLKAIHAQEDRTAALQKAEDVAGKLRGLKLEKAAKVLQAGIADTLAYYAFPSEHWRSLRTNNPLERLNREIRRRTRVVGCFPDGRSAVMLVTARLRYLASKDWGTKRYLNMQRLWDAAPSGEEGA
jgi:transposase-like protein